MYIKESVIGDSVMEFGNVILVASQTVNEFLEKFETMVHQIS